MTTSSVCVIVKNEVGAIAEWLAFQKIIGFDRILVYDNGSIDGTREAIEKIRSFDPTISLTPWPDRTGQAPQPTAYEDAARQCTTDWLAFFDADEFLVLHRHPNVNSLLSDVPNDYTAVAINWRIFGSAGQIRADKRLVIERFTRCAPYRHPKNRFCKTIVRRDAIKKVRVHTADLKFGGYVDSMLRPIALESDAKTPGVCLQGAQINHYLVKSWEEFKDKRARGNAARAPEASDKYSHRGDAPRPPRFRWDINPSNEFWVTHDLNRSRDLSIMVWREDLISMLGAWGVEYAGPPLHSNSQKNRIWAPAARGLASLLRTQT